MRLALSVALRAPSPPEGAKEMLVGVVFLRNFLPWVPQRDEGSKDPAT